MEDGHEEFYALNKFSFSFSFKLCYLVVVETAQCCGWSDFDKTSYFLVRSCTSKERFGRTTQELLFWSGDDISARLHNIDVFLGTILRHQDSPAK